MQTDTKALPGLLLVVTAIAILTVAISASNYAQVGHVGDGRAAEVVKSIPAAALGSDASILSNLSADPGSLSAQDGKSQDPFCAPSNYLGHYYNYYYGNKDGREFFYFERDWQAQCGR